MPDAKPDDDTIQRTTAVTMTNNEIAREFAPYIGVSWNRVYGNTADMARDEGGDKEEARLVAGVRMWF